MPSTFRRAFSVLAAATMLIPAKAPAQGHTVARNGITAGEAAIAGLVAGAIIADAVGSKDHHHHHHHHYAPRRFRPGIYPRPPVVVVPRPPVVVPRPPVVVVPRPPVVIVPRRR